MAKLKIGKKVFMEIILLLIFFVPFLLYSTSAYSSQWAKTFDSGRGDVARFIQQTSDGGYIVAGATESPTAGYHDVWVLKLNPDGTVAWQKTYGGDEEDLARFIQQTSDGGYILAGKTESCGAGDFDIWVLKLNPDGTINWQKTYGGSGEDNAYSIQQTSDGGYIVAGGNSSFGSGNFDIWVLKLNPDGTINWQKTYGGSGEDLAFSVKQTSDGGYIVAGMTESPTAGYHDVWVLKLNPDGTVFWQKTYDGDDWDEAMSIHQTSDGGYIMAGLTWSFVTSQGDIWILKLNPDGTVAWQKTYNWGIWNTAYSIQQTSDGGYAIAGFTWFTSQGYLWVLKLNPDGTVAWQKTYGGSNDEEAFSINQTSDGGYIVAGGTESSHGVGDAWVLKLDMNGEIPDCLSMGTSDAIVNNTNADVWDTTVAGEITTIFPNTSTVVATNSNATTIEVCSNDTPFPDISVAPTSHNFASINVGSSSSPQTFTISNTGTVDLVIDTVNITIDNIEVCFEIGCPLIDPASFILQNDTCSGSTLKPSETCTVQVLFRPSSEGTKVAALTIPSNDPDTLTLNVLLTGIGVLPPTIGYSPTSFSFIATQGGSNPANQTLSITNTGGGTLNWSVSDDATWLSLSPISGTGSGTITLSVNTAGLTAATYNATVTITDPDATNSPINIPVNLTVMPIPKLVLLTPNGGEVIPSGSTYIIRWEAPAKAVKFNLKYSINNTQSWDLINPVPVTGTSYQWKVPATWGNKKACFVKVIGYDASNLNLGADKSNAPFTIEVVKLTSPKNNDILRSGNTHTITWQTNATKNPVAKVNLFYAEDGGFTWTSIGILIGNPGSFAWTVPNVLTIKRTSKVRVVLLDANGYTLAEDGSDGYFKIQP